MSDSKILDCLIIGGGPSGLTAAEYLGRFLRKTVVIDSRESRAALIPTSHNYPGFAEGISGNDFLEKLRDQAAKYGVPILQAKVTSLRKEEDIFIADWNGGTVRAKKVILATGIRDEQPSLPNLKEFVYNGQVRFCPVCDGYEAMDKKIAIIGPCSRIYKKACFLRSYSRDIVLFPLDGDHDCDRCDIERLHSLGVRIPRQQITELILQDDIITGVYEDGSSINVDIIYPAMGAVIRTDFIEGFEINCNELGCVFTDGHQQTNIEGLYAIGDITLDLSQMAVGTGQAAIAATAIHNALPLNCR